MPDDFRRNRDEIPDSEKDLVHLVAEAPEKGATVKCRKCFLVFKSDAATWTTDARAHGGNRFKGAHRSCRPNPII